MLCSFSLNFDLFLHHFLWQLIALLIVQHDQTSAFMSMINFARFIECCSFLFYIVNVFALAVLSINCLHFLFNFVFLILLSV